MMHWKNLAPKQGAVTGRAWRSFVVAALVAVGVSGFWHLGHSRPALAAKPVPAASQRLVLPATAPQRNFLVLESVSEAVVPSSDPLNARLQLDEDRTARIFAPLAGRVLALRAAAGDRVAAGAALAVLDAPDFGAAIAELHKARALATQKLQARERARVLYAGEALARRELEATEAEALAAEAEVERARWRLANLTPPGQPVQGQQLVLRAPLAGTVVERQANPGTEVRVDAERPLFVLSDLTRLWLNIDLPEKFLAKAQRGALLRFGVDAYPGETFEARILQVGAMLDPATRRVPVRAALDNRDGRLKPEMYARVQLAEADGQKAIRLPIGALLTSGLISQVFVETEPGTFERRSVRVLRQDAEAAYLTPESPVVAGDRVVVRGALLLASELAQGEQGE